MRARSTRQDVPAPESGAGVGSDRGRPKRAVYSPVSEFSPLARLIGGLINLKEELRAAGLKTEDWAKELFDRAMDFKDMDLRITFQEISHTFDHLGAHLQRAWLALAIALDALSELLAPDEIDKAAGAVADRIDELMEMEV